MREICRFHQSPTGIIEKPGYDNPPASPRELSNTSETPRVLSPARSSRRADCSPSRSCNLRSAMASAPTSVWSARGYMVRWWWAILDAEQAVLVEEYCAGVTNTSCRCRGLVERARTSRGGQPGTQEGKRATVARQLEHSPELSLSPGYMSQRIQVVRRDLRGACRATSRSRWASIASACAQLSAGPSTLQSQRKAAPLGRAVPGARPAHPARRVPGMRPVPWANWWRWCGAPARRSCRTGAPTWQCARRPTNRR